MASNTLTTSLAQAADTILREREDVTLTDWLRDQSEAHAGYRLIASRLHAATGGVVTPGHETVRRWMIQLDIASEAGR